MIIELHMRIRDAASAPNYRLAPAIASDGIDYILNARRRRLAF